MKSAGWRVMRMGRCVAKVVFGACLLVFAAGIAGSEESQLWMDVGSYCDDRPEPIPWFSCDAAVSLQVMLGNGNDFEVFEGFEVFSAGLSVEIFSAAGERVAWWDPRDDDDGNAGSERRWEPDEWVVLDIPWYFQTGPFEGAYFGTEEEFERPVAPFNSYEARVKWHSVTGEVLLEGSFWIHHQPPYTGEAIGGCPEFEWLDPDFGNAVAGVPFAVMVPVLDICVLQRTVEVDVEAKEIVVDVSSGCGCPWGFCCSRFVQRLPALPAGSYTLRFPGIHTTQDSWEIHVHDVVERNDESQAE
ncbi:MAG: hypothetical protein DRJ65_09780 [Acidobacteria bacterium]|nr:MAG: hypothetical protein DRJ65_09780 [Acidobacteriota bacterium]